MMLESSGSAPIPLPDDPFSPFSPSQSQLWDMRRVGHLLRRATFGASFDGAAALLKKSPDQAVTSLMDLGPNPDPMDSLSEQLIGFFNPNRIDSQQEWWLFRMLNTASPLREKMALFWHGLFATSQSKVQNAALMAQQIGLFRKHALGNFRDLLKEVTRNPAMLIWLDGNTNRRGAANENYGREVMELFTLGVGTYTEKDVKELARAFTGWRVDGDHAVFDSFHFDNAQKTIFGKTGNFDSDRAIDLILEQPAAPLHLSRKLLRAFLHPDPTDQVVAHYAQRLIKAKWELKPVMRDLFLSRLFFSDWAYRSIIKSPVELTVGAVAAVGGKASTQFLRDQTGKMGQTLLMPPNVKGWDGEEAWINANTVLLRFNFGLALALQRGDDFAVRADLDGWLHQHNLKTADDILDHYLRLLLDGNVTASARAELLDFLNHGPQNQPRPFVLTAATMNSKVRGLQHLIMAMPEFELA
jgi:uncharacterized protein (DUF1800 family)